MYLPQTIYTKIALQTIHEYLVFGSTEKIEQMPIPEELLVHKSCFVSLHTSKNNELRGCIGTIHPVEDNLFYEIIRNSISSATRDRRFKPLTIKELNDIQISVDVLSIPEKKINLSHHNPKTNCLIISDKKYRKGILLPNLEGVETKEQQIEIIKRKAGILQNEVDLEYFTFTVERFY